MYFGGVLAAERAAAVPCHAAVAVHDDLATGQPRIALWAAHNESPRGVYEHLLVVHFEARVAHHRPHHMGEDAGPELRVVDHVGVLRRYDNRVDGDRLGPLVYPSDLRLAVWPQPWELPALPH